MKTMRACLQAEARGEGFGVKTYVLGANIVQNESRA